MKNIYYFQIALSAPLFKTLFYKSFQILQIGQRVKVPLGKRRLNGLVLKEILEPVNLEKIKEVLELDESSTPLSSQRIQWLIWMSSYYHYPLGMIAELNFPQKTFSKQLKSKEKRKDETPCKYLYPKRLQLNLDQKNCAENILKKKDFDVHLIHGVTGSGKTEVYKELIAHTLNQGLQVLVLLPEIFLTPQIVKRFSDSFPGQTALLHSQITAKQKKSVWNELILQKKNLLVGTRSALFCPLPQLGLIIIDEEHDSSFKQEDKFRYHARDSAIVLAKELGIPIVLGSATPDFSSYKKALDGSYKLHELKHRAFKQNLPKVSIVDLKIKPTEDRPFWLSDFLFEKIQETLKRGLQVALFLNRRGKATTLICIQCGHSRKCLNCDISLTLHRNGFLLCHYCSYLEKQVLPCSSCKGSQWLERGLGTQQIQKVMEKYFPNYQTFRADRDSIHSQEEIEDFIDIVEKKKAQIIIGTQMLSKGLNFSSIYLVGLVVADMDFHFPDFRAGERAFQTLLQMAGRAGRTSFGEVVLQTFNPEHLSIFFAKQHDYKNFFKEEIKSRKKWSYPPFSRLCMLRIDSLKEKEGQIYAKEIAQKAEQLSSPEVQILGPSPAPLMKIKNRHRFQILIKAESHQALHSFIQILLPNIQKRSFVQVKVDRDPLSMF